MFNQRTTLQRARQKKTWTQEQVANMLGVSVRSYQRYESGERTPSLKRCAQLEQMFGIPIRKLLVQDDTPIRKAQ